MQETNTYAARTGAPSGWYDTSVEEMKAFIRMLIIMVFQNFVPLKCIGLLKSVCVHFAYGRIALSLNYWADLDDFWMRMIAIALPFFSYPFRGSSGSKSKVHCIAISKVWTTGMLVAGEGPPDKRAGAPTSSKSYRSYSQPALDHST